MRHFFRGWVGPWRPPIKTTHSILKTSQKIADRLPGYSWALIGLAIGTIPPLIEVALGLPGQRLISAILLSACLVVCVSRDKTAAGLMVMFAAMLGHNAFFIETAWHRPEQLQAIFPPGFDYWHQSHSWIITGESREYDPAWWLPAHFQLIGGVCVLGYTSLGTIPFWQGFHEVDLMNVYVGRLMAHSHNPWLALLVGWHPWSICRGLGYLLFFEIVSFSLEKLSAEKISNRKRRVRRVGLGLFFLALDVLLKWTLLESVRSTLASNLLTLP